jgi:hypothetical protein
MSRWQQLYAIGDPDNPHNIYVSDDLDATDWAAGNSFYIEVGSGQNVELVDWCDVRGVLYMFSGSKDPSVWRLDGYSINSYRLRQILRGLRCLPRTAAATPNNALFTTPLGVFDVGTAEAGELQRERSLSERILTQITGMSDPRAVYSPQFDGYLITDSGTTTWMANLKVSGYTWTKLVWPYSITAFCVAGDTLYLGTSIGDIYKYDPTAHQDPGPTAVATIFTTADTDLGDPTIKKNVRGITGNFRNCGATQVDVAVYKDHGGAAIVTKNVTSANQTRVNYNCDYTQLKLTFTTPTSRIRFRKLGLVTRPVRRRIKT